MAWRSVHAHVSIYQCFFIFEHVRLRSYIRTIYYTTFSSCQCLYKSENLSSEIAMKLGLIPNCIAVFLQFQRPNYWINTEARLGYAVSSVKRVQPVNNISQTPLIAVEHHTVLMARTKNIQLQSYFLEGSFCVSP